MTTPSLQLTPEAKDCRVELSCREETADGHPELMLQSFSCGGNAVRSTMALFDTLAAIIVRQDFYNRNQRTGLTASFMQGKEQRSLSKANSHSKDA